MVPDPLNPGIPPTGLPEEPDPTDPSPNQDVVDPTIPQNPDSEPYSPHVPGRTEPEPSY